MMARHFGEIAIGRNLDQAVAKLAGRGVKATYRTYTDGKRTWVAEAGCKRSPFTGKPALSDVKHEGPTGFGRALASVSGDPDSPLNLLSNQCPGCNMVAVSQASSLLAHCVACGAALPQEAEDDAGIFITEAAMPKDYSALLDATPAEAANKGGGLPPVDTIKNTGLQALPELDELDLVAQASEEEDLFADLATLSPGAIVEDFGDGDGDEGCGDDGCGDDDGDEGYGDGDESLACGDGFGSTGLDALPELSDDSVDASYAASLEALANPENYENLDVLDGMACASAGVPSDLRLVFAPGSGRGDSTWFAMASGQPIAVASEGNQHEGIRRIFGTGNYQQLVLEAVASVGLVNGLRSCGFSGITVSVPVKQAINSAVASATAAASAEAAKARTEYNELFSQSVSMAAVAMNKNFYADRPNPLRASIIDSCVRNGMSQAVAASVADASLAVAGTDYAGELLDLAEQFMNDSPEVRAAMASAIGKANYIEVPVKEVPAVAKRTSAIASAHAVVSPAMLPTMSQPAPVQHRAVAAPSSFNALLDSLMPLGNQ